MLGFLFIWFFLASLMADIAWYNMSMTRRRLITHARRTLVIFVRLELPTKGGPCLGWAGGRMIVESCTKCAQTTKRLRLHRGTSIKGLSKGPNSGWNHSPGLFRPGLRGGAFPQGPNHECFLRKASWERRNFHIITIGDIWYRFRIAPSYIFLPYGYWAIWDSRWVRFEVNDGLRDAAEAPL